ncbi:unnamed protein product [Penicillium roqueforti FM164]|uniref:Genomic scaffold, ProqFM164S02 n=1 Tax=Penicillium roqueforti (strain FM164) TaxID=1365484 RepID=W6Q5B7_PENRF|nr:unnamed protein product [Penicillium roqueforti FM164]
MDPSNLARVLIGGEPLHPVEGVACKVLSREIRDRLVAYVSKRNEFQSIYIYCLDIEEEKVEGVALSRVTEWELQPSWLQSSIWKPKVLQVHII